MKRNELEFIRDHVDSLDSILEDFQKLTEILNYLDEEDDQKLSRLTFLTLNLIEDKLRDCVLNMRHFKSETDEEYRHIWKEQNELEN